MGSSEIVASPNTTLRAVTAGAGPAQTQAGCEGTSAVYVPGSGDAIRIAGPAYSGQVALKVNSLNLVKSWSCLISPVTV